MSHLSIALLRAKTKNYSEANKEFKYLVQFNDEDEHMFFDLREMAIGGGFDFFKLKKSVDEYFELPTIIVNADNSESKVDYEDKFLFAENPSSPVATSYIFTLSDIQYELIESSIQLKSSYDDKWKYLKWVSEDDLELFKKKWVETQKFIFANPESFKVPKFSNELRAGFRNIVKALASGKLVIFAGAGVSVDSLLPTWSELTRGLKEDLDEEANTDLQLAQLYFETRGNKEFQEKVQQLLKHGTTSHNPIHRRIVDISPMHIVTTNFDNHFEQINIEEGFKYSIVKDESDLPYSKGASMLVKMHGDLEARNIVLKKDDFKDYEKKFPLIDGFVKGVFASKLVLFVGFRYDDPNLNRIRKWVGNLLEKDGQRPYIVFDTITQSRKSKLENTDKLAVLEIGTSISKASIDNYYRSFVSDDIKLQINELRSMKSKNLFRFLSVIGEYDMISDSFEISTMEEQFRLSLGRFLELNSLPRKTLESLYPFKKKGPRTGDKFSKARMDYDVLETPNEFLIDFIKKYSNSNNEIKFHSYIKDSHSTSRQEIDRMWKLLFNSGVRYIKRKNDTSSERYSLNPINLKNEVQCECAKCLLDRNEYNKLLHSINKLSHEGICKQSNIQIDLTNAYGLFNAGYMVKAFYALEELKINSKKRSEFITYFISCFNQKRLKQYMWYSNANYYDEEDLGIINQKIDKIDLDKILVELPVDNDVKSALTFIKNDSIAESSLLLVEGKLTKILDLLKSYENGGFRHFGPDYGYQVAFEIFSTTNFYHQNRLFSSETSKFRKLTMKYIEATIAVYRTSIIEGEIKEIGTVLASMAVKYAPAKEMLSLLKEYKIENFLFYKEELFKTEFIKGYNEFINSGFIENNFIHRSSSPNAIYEDALRNSNFFSIRAKNTFDNYLLMFSHIDLKDSQYEDILNKSLDYLEVSTNFRFVDSLTYWDYFIQKRVESFKETTLKRVVSFLLSDKPNGFGSATNICSAIVNKRKLKEFLDFNYLDVIISRHNTNNRREDMLFCFYPLLNVECKKKWKKTLHNNILESDNKTKIDSYWWGIWSPENDIQIFHKFLNELKDSAISFGDYTIDEKGYVIDLDRFDTWNDLVNLVSWVYAYELFEDDRIIQLVKSMKSKMFKWLLNPLGYSYQYFDFNWLNAFWQDIYISKWSESEKFLYLTEEQLIEAHSERISMIYFQMKRNRRKNLMTK